MMLEYAIQAADWSTDHAALTDIRHEVFVDEQQVPVELEIDALDPHCLHVKATLDNGDLIGTARLLPDGYIGRMCVRRAYRGQGVGGDMLRYLIDQSRQDGRTRLLLNAQLSALPFYQRFGFKPQGSVFVEAGIQHQLMTLTLK